MYKPDFRHISFKGGSNKNLFSMLSRAIGKVKPKKVKEPKGDANDGAYCPKMKPGQSWAYSKDRKEEEEE